MHFPRAAAAPSLLARTLPTPATLTVLPVNGEGLAAHARSMMGSLLYSPLAKLGGLSAMDVAISGEYIHRVYASKLDALLEGMLSFENLGTVGALLPPSFFKWADGTPGQPRLTREQSKLYLKQQTLVCALGARAPACRGRGRISLKLR